LEKNMNKILSITATLLAVAAMPMAASACDAAGKNTHVGQVLSSDGNQFTIRDAQSGKPIRFTTTGNTADALPAAGDRVAVKYSESEQGLVAETIR